MSKKRCVYCDSELTRFRVDKIDSSYDEIGLINKLENKEIELIHGKCISCGSIIAADDRTENSRQLLSAYADAPSSYVYDSVGFNKHIPFYKRIENLINPLKHSLSICDVGCNSGEFLKMLNVSWKKYGVEPSFRALDTLKTEDIDIFHGTLSHSPFDRYSMDVITYFDVFEHLDDPKQEIEVAKSFLAPNGKIVILTGNATSLTAKLAGATWSYLKQTGHICIASEKAITTALKNAGFNNIFIHRISHPYSRQIFDYIILMLMAKIFNNPSKIKIFNREYTVPLFQDHMLIIASND
jgi:SAM-dependent methyltransferase